MHGNVVPTPIQTTGAEGTVRLYPLVQTSLNHCLQCSFQLREPISKEQAKIDAFCAIIKLALVNGQTRRLRKWFWQSVGGKEIVEIIFNSFSKGIPAPFVAS